MKIFVHYLCLEKLLNTESSTNKKVLTKIEKKNIQNQRNFYLKEFLHTDKPINITEDRYGKPYVIDYPHLCFNQSHSQSFYALVYNKQNVHVGVDIEDFSRSIHMDALAKRYFHIEEVRKWEEMGKSKKIWLKIWTIKEAVLKAHGLGIRLSLKSLNTNIDDRSNTGMVEHEQLGLFRYQCFDMKSSMMTIAYQDFGMDAEIVFK